VNVSRETLETFGRDEFLNERFSYDSSGPHITIVGPTRCGKSYLAQQLIDRIARPEHPAIWLMKKPRDPLVAAAGRQLGLKRVRDWPPLIMPWQRKPRGYLVWPKTSFDPDVDHPHKHDVFRRALMHSYKRGHRIIYVDDTYGIGKVLGLNNLLIELWTELGSMDAGLIAGFQKPSHVPLWAYNQAEHLFLFHDPDKRSRERFQEIGGVDGHIVQDTVMRLQRHQALYIRRLGPAMCIVDK
jgi:hypothetical protein